MRQIFQTIAHEQFFRQNGYLVFDLLDDKAIGHIHDFYQAEFSTKREVFPFAKELPYYISIFDTAGEHKKKVDQIISAHVSPATDALLCGYEVFYSNFMIKFPGDGQIEAHQDFNFVDESIHTAFNLWCPLVDTDRQNGGLFVIPGSHQVFKTQRGPNFPQALTQYNQLLKRYAVPIPLKKGQAIIFDHKLIHYSPANHTDQVRVAIQSVLKPKETPALHYIFDAATRSAKAYRIDKEFIFRNDLWNGQQGDLPLDHEQALIPFPAEEELVQKLVGIKTAQIRQGAGQASRSMFADQEKQQFFAQNGFVKLPLLGAEEVRQLKELFTAYSGGQVKNTDYGMYISLEEEDTALKERLIRQITAIVRPCVDEHFLDCKQHLGSFLVKAPGAGSYTYPHQDWTFVLSPPYCSVTIWIALTDTDESNGVLGFVPGSHLFFDGLVGSPSPEFQTCTQGHEPVFYEYLRFVPLKAGEAVAFDNRTIHGATPNTSGEQRIAVAIGMTPAEAPLYHHYLLPGPAPDGYRRIARLKVDESFFHRHTLQHLKALYMQNQLPEHAETEAVVYDEFIPFTQQEIGELCIQAGLQKNGKHLQTRHAQTGQVQKDQGSGSASLAARIWNRLFKSRHETTV